MIGIVPDALNALAMTEIDHMTAHVQRAIRFSFHALGKDLRQESRRLMKETERNFSRTYTVRVRGRDIRHNPSKPGFAPAILTGRLASSVDYRTSGSDTMVFGAGEEGGRVNYAKDLELGSRRVQARPFLKPAIINSDRNAQTHFETFIAEALKT